MRVFKSSENWIWMAALALKLLKKAAKFPMFITNWRWIENFLLSIFKLVVEILVGLMRKVDYMKLIFDTINIRKWREIY
jgi:hypothetical protein